MSEERERIQKQIYALRKSRDTYAAYGAVAEADRLLNEIADLEGQLAQINERKRAAPRGERGRQ